MELSSIQSSKQYQPKTEEEKLYSQKRCMKCRQYYIEAENGECKYHSGVYTAHTNALQGTEVGWSCCRIKEYIGPTIYDTKLFSVLNDDALNKNGKGCKTAAKHTEDAVYTEATANFPFDLNAAKQAALERSKSSSNSTPAIKSETEKTKGSEDKTDDNEKFIKHNVVEGDTLVGISLKYNVPVPTLQRANRLTSHQIFHKKSLVIPLAATPADVIPQDNLKSEALRKFQKQTGASREETQLYLDEHNYNLEEALSHWEKDSKWEKEHQRKSSTASDTSGNQPVSS